MMYYLRFGAARQPALIPLQAPLGIVATVPSRGWTPWLRAPLGWLAALLLLGTSAPAVAQISSPQTIPSGTYPTIASAIAALNNGVTGGVGAGGVTFNVAAGYTETMGSVAAGRLNITVNKPTGANQIIFQKSGSGANPKITAGAGGSTAVDAIISLSGTDFTTFDGIDLLDPSSNSTQTTAMEAGYALFRPAAADGCQNNTVKNCTITLNRSNIASASGVTYGIWAANVTATNGAITTNNITGANSNNKFYGNTILNTQLGIYLQGYADGTAPYTYFDQSNDIGGASTSTGNTIQNFGGVASTTTYGIRLSYQNAVNASYNTINNAANGGSASPATLNGIGQITGNYVGGTYSNNTITLTQGGHGSAVYGVNLQYTAVTASTGAVTVSNNVFAVSYSAAGSGQVNAIYLLPGGTAGTFGSETVSGNTLSGTSGSPMQINTTGSVYFIYANNATPNVTVTNNTSNYVSKTSAGGTFYGYTDSGTNPASGTATVTGNTISNITLTGATGFEGIDHRTSTNQTCTVINNTVGPVTLGTSAAYGVYSGYGTSTSTFDSNTVTSLTGGSGAVYGLYLIATSTATAASNNVTNLSSSGAVYGVYLSGSGTSTTFTRGNVNTLSTSGTSTAYGVFIASGAVTNVTRTKIYGLSASAAGGSVTGIHSAAGTTNTLTNNLIGDLTAPAATGNNAVNGVYVAGGTNTNLYYNTIDVTGSGGSSFGSSGVYVASNTPTVDMRANIIINKATAGIGGATVAYRRLNATLTTFATASNNNLLYTPCGGYLYGEGVGVPTNTQTTIASYKAYVGPTRETNAKTEDVPFLSATGSSANFLHINTGVATQVENGGVSVSGITNDYDNDARNASTPDIGADEGPFTGPANMAVVSSSYTPQSGNSSTPSMNQYTTLVTVNTTGTQNPLTVTDLTLTMGGTAASASIINAKVFAGGCSATFSTTTQALPTEVAPSGTFTLTFATPVTLLTGANTFFVTFDVASGAVNAATFSATPTVVAFSSGPSSTPTLSGSMVARTIVGPLNGTYLVGQGQTSPNYATLTAALADLQALGVNGAVTFSLTNSTFVPYNTGNGETFPLIINGTYTGAGTFPVTIKPAATKQPIISAITTTALVILNEAKNVTIDGSNTVGGTTQDLLIYDLSGATTAAVWVKSNGTGAQNNTIKNTNLAAGASQNASTSVTFGIFQGGATLGIANAGTGNNSNVFQNNYVIQARYGIFSIGNSTTPNTGTQINDNQIGPVKTIPFGLGSSGFGALEIGRAGVVVAGDNGAIITGNEVGYVGGNYANTPSGAVRAGIVLGSDAGTVSSTAISSLVYNARVASNRVHDIVEERTLSAIGIVVAGTNGGAATNNQVYSNFIYNVKANGTAGNAASGIDLLYGNGDVVAYNSINLYGALDPTAAATAAAGSAFALTIGSSANVTNPSIRNNAVAVDVTSRITTLKHGAIVTPAAYAWGTGGADRNDYYYNASNTQLWTGSVGTPSGGGTFFQTLNDWQTATSQDANSIQSDPQFTSPSDPHTFAVALDGAGRGIAGLSTDIDGDTRLTGAAQATDIGADEFSQPSVDVKPFALAAPAASSVCYTNAESVMVTIQNNSNTTALDFTAHPITVTVSVTGAVTQSFTTTINSNAGNPGGTALVSGATRDVTLPGALNMTTVGTYNFAVAATAGGSPSDQVTSNDVLATQTRTVSTPTAGTAAASPGTICGPAVT